MIGLLLNQECGVGQTTLALHFAGVRACQSRPLTVIDADGTAVRGSGQASVRMLGYQAASLRRTYGRLTPATTELTSNSETPLSAAVPTTAYRRHGATASGAPCSAWDRYRWRAARPCTSARTTVT
jgi:hypothetical protein